MSKSPMGSLLGKLECKFQRGPFPVLELHQREQYWFRLWGNRVDRGQFYISYVWLRPQFTWQELERRHERNDLSKRKMTSTFCSTDILSKMFGPSYQEGEGHAGSDSHILGNPFPQEWGEKIREIKQYISEIVYVDHVSAPYRLWKHWHKINNYL